MNQKMKKGLAILLVFSMLFSMIPVSAFAAVGDTFTDENGIRYQILSNGDNPGTAAVIGYEEDLSGDVTIPASVTKENSSETYTVTNIGNLAFGGCTSLSSIDIPDSVTSIGECAFYGCSSLNSITIPNSVTSIGANAFEGCEGLTSITFVEDSKLESIGNIAFHGCKSLTSITIPASVTSIGTSAFQDCGNLTSVTFGENTELQTIDFRAFAYCRNLKEISIPDSVTNIGGSVFLQCDSLKSIEIPASLTSIDNMAFAGWTGLEEIVIPATVTTISAYAFKNCTGLERVTFEDDSKLQTIDKDAFEGCTGLCNAETGEHFLHQLKCIVCGLCTHKDENDDHFCDIEEGNVRISECADADSDHKCDVCKEVLSECADNDKDHNCDVCSTATSVCEDADKDHACDHGCGEVYGEHKAADGKHTCDYCGETVTQCADTTPKDYKCDICGKAVGTRPSSGGSYNYPVKADKADGADVTLSDEHATKGETVTITVKPEAGKQVDEVIVTDAEGKVIAVTKIGDNQYTFTMPAGKVNIKVTTEAADYDLRIVMQINNKNIVANNRTITNDVAPVIVGDRTLVPVRAVTELLGGKADWNGATRTVTLTIDGKVLSMTIGKEIPGFGTSAVIMNSRTYVPIRYVAEMLGASVEWVAETQQIVIEK